MGDGTGAITDDLHLDVAGPGQEFFDIEFSRAKSLLGFRAGAGKRFGEIVDFCDRAHAASPAAGNSLQHHRAVGPEGLEKRQRLIERDRVAESR